MSIVKRILSNVRLDTNVQAILNSIELKGGPGSGVYDHKKGEAKKYIPHPRAEEINKTDTPNEGHTIKLANQDSHYPYISMSNGKGYEGEYVDD